jgi:hypothetical protein
MLIYSDNCQYLSILSLESIKLFVFLGEILYLQNHESKRNHKNN